VSRRSAPVSPADPEEEAEAAATATVIAGLRWRLRNSRLLEHEAVLDELRKLEAQVDVQLARAPGSPGRHRCAPPGSRGGAEPGGFDRPDPLTARTAAEFMVTLRRYRDWSGRPSWRKMADRAGQVVVHSTMHAAMRADTLPRLTVVQAIVAGCGGSEADLAAFVTAWQRIDSGPALMAAPVPAPALHLVRG
jgi:hypothetical protein